MNLFLRAKHWHLFVLLFVLPLLIQLTLPFQIIVIDQMGEEPTIEELKLYFSQFFESMRWLIGLSSLSGLILYGWMISVAIGLRKYTPEAARLKTAPFIINLIISIVSVFAMLYFTFSFFTELIDLGEELVTGERLPVSMFKMIACMPFNCLSVLYLYYYTAKAYKNALTRRRNRFGTFVGEFFMLMFWVIGIWFIQPGVNKIITGPENPEVNEEDDTFEDYTN